MATNCANRRPMRLGAFASSLRTFAISHVPWCPGHRAQGENEVLGVSSRDISENSNERFAGTAFGSGFVAPFDPAAEEIFSARLTRFEATSASPRRSPQSAWHRPARPQD